MEIDLNELQLIAENARDNLKATAASVGRKLKIYLHWTAGKHYTTFDDYHICIDGDGIGHVKYEIRLNNNCSNDRIFATLFSNYM